MMAAPSGHVFIRYEDGVNVTHSGRTLALKHISLDVSGSLTEMLTELKEKDEMWRVTLEKALELGIVELYNSKKDSDGDGSA